jgi:phosphate starvation-inducible PhoH-like protein
MIEGNIVHVTDHERLKQDHLILDNNSLARNLFGEQELHLKIIEKELKVRIHTRGAEATIVGDLADVALSKKVLQQLYGLLTQGYPVYPADVGFAVRILSGNDQVNLKDIFLDQVYISSKKRIITPKTLNQKKYIDAIRKNDIVFGIGPAGTGKTYLAMAMAVASLAKNEMGRIILARPAVEAGEKLGFLPGDLYEKVNPYLRPLYDALHDMMDFEKASRLIQHGTIEVAPLAFMRGRTLNEAFVILDEAQNSTSEQMKMFLTRLGFGSKAVITGDITQIDLPNGTTSGLIEASEILRGINGISCMYFGKEDVIRHRLVQDIIRAYEELDEMKRKPRCSVT